jgi:hypothetical protein
MDRHKIKLLFSGVFLLALIVSSGCEKKNEIPVESHQEQVNQLYADYDQYFQSYLAQAVQAVGKPTIVGEDYVNSHCWRYQTAKPMLDAGTANTGDMLNIMNAIRPTSGGTRTLWTSIMDVNSRTFEVYYRKEYSRKFVFGF